MANKVENVHGSLQKLHISVEVLLSKLRAAGVTAYCPDYRDNNKIITMDISYFDGLTKITKK